MKEKRFAEIELKFPYLHEPNRSGLRFEENTSTQLDFLINKEGRQIPVTWYPSMGEYQYATGSTYRYATVDIMFQVGNVVRYNTDTEMLTLRVREDIAPVINELGKATPRGMVRLSESDNYKMILDRLICIDIILKEENTNE